jgi:hypothetical protein
MLTKDIDRVIDKITLLGTCLLGAIDAGEANGISVDEIYAKIEDKSILEYLDSKFRMVRNWALPIFSVEDKYRLLGEWQSMANVIDAERKLGISNNGVNLLISYIFEGVRMRSHIKDAWPCPEPD